MAPRGRIETVAEGLLRAWLWDPDRPGDRLTAVVAVDGSVVARLVADLPRGDLRAKGIGDGRHGVECPLPPALQDGGAHQVTLAAATPAGELAIETASRTIPVRAAAPQGKVERILDDQLLGWVWDRAQPSRIVGVELLHEGQVLATARADRYRGDLLRAGIGHGAHGFALPLGALRPPPPPGATLEVRTDAALGHWRIGAARLPSAPEPPAPRAAGAAPPPRALLNEARQAEAARDFATAARLLDEALALAPADFDLLFTRARVAIALQDLGQGRELARRALALRPGHLRPTVLLARIASAEDRHAEAAALWAQVPPGDAAWRERSVRRSRSLVALGRLPEALAEHAAVLRGDPADREALRGLAELTEALGGRRTALRHWRRYLAVAPPDPVAAEHVRALERSLAPPEGPASPLRDPWLRAWPGPLEGQAGAAPEGLPGVLALRSLDPAGGRLHWALAGARERRPGELPCYGLWLRAEGAGAEALFALDEAAPALAGGLRMSIELRALAMPPGRKLALEIGLLAGGPAGAWRGLLRAELGSRPCMLCFTLRPTAAELAMAGDAPLWLGVRWTAPGTLELHAPQPVAPLDAEAPGLPAAPEQEGLAEQLAALGLALPRAGVAAPPGAGAPPSGLSRPAGSPAAPATAAPPPSR